MNQPAHNTNTPRFTAQPPSLDFKGLTDWVHIFSAGQQQDSKGRQLHFTQADLQHMADVGNNGRPARHVITHKELYSPFKFGDATCFKVEGDHLYAKSTQVAPQLEALVKNGNLPDRSVRLHKVPTGYAVDHIAWLGAEPPAVEGLEPVQFAANGTNTFDFSYPGHDSYTPRVLGRFLRRLKNFVLAEHGEEKAENILPEYELETIAEHAEDLSRKNNAALEQPEFTQHPPNTTEELDMTPEELAAQKQQAADEALATAQADFQQKLDAKEAELKAQQHAANVKDYQQFASGLVTAQLCSPAQVEGMAEFMAALDADTQLEFSRGEGETAEQLKKQPVQWFTDFCKSLKPSNLRTEQAATDFAAQQVNDFVAPTGTSVDTERSALHAKALDYQRQHNTDYLTAARAVGA